MECLRFSCQCFPLGLLWCYDLYLILISTLNLFCVWYKFVIEFHFFPHSCPDLPTPFVEEVIFAPFYAPASFVKYSLTIETWVYIWALSSVPLVYVPVLMPIPGCFDYSGLVIQFDIRYCDPSYFVLLSQNSGSLGVPYKFLKCLFYICEICHGDFNRDCIESINRFG